MTDDHDLKGIFPLRKNSSRITIVGGAGRMGAWIARFLKEKGMGVILCDKREKAVRETAQELGVTWKPMDTACEDSEVVVVSVPMRNVVQVCREVSRQMKKDSMLVEISSVKSGVSDALSKTLPKHIGYVSLHPLFGPDVQSLKGRNVVAIETGNDKYTQKVVGFLRNNGADVAVISVEEHDHAMAFFQVLHHFLMLSFARTIDAFMPNHLVKKELVTHLLGTTLGSEAAIFRNLPTIIEIQETNPFSEETRRRFASEVQRMIDEDPKVLDQQLKKAARKISTLV